MYGVGLCMTCRGEGCRGNAETSRAYKSFTLSTPFGAVRIGMVGRIRFRESAQDARNVRLDDSLWVHSALSVSHSSERLSEEGPSLAWRRRVCWKRSWLISSTRAIASLRVGVDEAELANGEVSDCVQGVRGTVDEAGGKDSHMSEASVWARREGTPSERRGNDLRTGG